MSFVLDRIGQLLTLEGAVKKQGRNISKEDLSIVKDACLVVQKNKILWSGFRGDLPKKYKKFKRINAHGGIVLPGFVDSHTHLVFAGDRSQEFEMRLAGHTYQQIAASGGGIINSVQATRNVSFEDLYKLSLKRAQVFLRSGVTTFEIKTGYGLNLESETKCLKVIQALKKNLPATILSTFLAAHAVPEEFKGRRKEYIQEICRWLPKVKDRVDFVDIFLDEGYFDREDADKLLSLAQKLKIPTKLHADELKLTGGSETAVKFKSLSADHLLQIGDAEVKLLSKSETTATLLPTTAFFLNAPYAPARKLLEAGARVALATDFNPGTSPTQDLSLVGLLAALHMKMRTEEILVGLTLNGAYALGLEKEKGALLPGFDADFIILEAESPAKLFYEFGVVARNMKVYSKGRWI
jgi:imidazolonepropionase